jgi:hypothetical protein
MSSRIPEQMNLCQVLSWIAFRNERFVTSDPDKLRRDMRRYRKRLIEPNPAGDFLRMAQANKIATQGNFGKIEAIDWQRVSEAELWEIIEREWARLKEVQ